MNTIPVKPEKKSKKLWVLAVGSFLVLACVIAFFTFRNLPLSSNSVSVQVVTDKPAYLQGENVTIQVYMINEKSVAISYPTSIGYTIEDSNGTEIFGFVTDITWASPYPTFASHSKTLFTFFSDEATFVWNQNDIEHKAAEPGIYTIRAFLGHNSSQCDFEILPNPSM